MQRFPEELISAYYQYECNTCATLLFLNRDIIRASMLFNCVVVFEKDCINIVRNDDTFEIVCGGCRNELGVLIQTFSRDGRINTSKVSFDSECLAITADIQLHNQNPPIYSSSESSSDSSGFIEDEDE